MKTLTIPFDTKLQQWVKARQLEGVNARGITKILQLHEITGEDLDEIYTRYKLLQTEVKRTLYGIQS